MVAERRKVKTAKGVGHSKMERDEIKRRVVDGNICISDSIVVFIISTEL